MINLFKDFIYSFTIGDYFFFLGSFVLIILFIYILYLIKLADIEEDLDFDIKKVKEDIEETYKPTNIVLTPYEERQEEEAIISYDELIRNKHRTYDFDDEYDFEYDDLNVKKIDLNTFGDNDYNSPGTKVNLFTYEKEEEFLRTLKELKQKLNI